MAKCALCDGLGKYIYPPTGRWCHCNQCNGTGKATKVWRSCSICNGLGHTGRIPSGIGNTRFERCLYCNGDGGEYVFE